MAKRAREPSASYAESPLTLPSTIDAQQEAERAHTPKYYELDHEAEAAPWIMQCTLPSHEPLSFASHTDYETHYIQAHTYRCRDCRKNFPSSRFLDLHIAENHDPITAAKHARGDKTYACFVEGCEKVCSEWQKRRSHLVDKHGFPRNYDFLVVNTGIDGKTNMLRPGVDSRGHRKSSRDRNHGGSPAAEPMRSKVDTPQATQDEEESIVSASTDSVPVAEHVDDKDSEMDEVIQSMSALKFVPRSVTFGKRKPRSGFAKS